MSLLDFYYILIYIAVAFAAIGQVFLKKGATLKTTPILGLRLNVMIALGIACLICSVLLSVQGMQRVPLRDVAAIIPLAYVFVPFLSRVFLKEPLRPNTLIGTAVIIIGMTLFNIQLLQLL